MQHIIRSERTTRSAVSTQLHHSMRLTEIVAGHSTMLDILWSKHVGRKSSLRMDKGPKSREGMCLSKRKGCSSSGVAIVASTVKDSKHLGGEKQIKDNVKGSEGKCNDSRKAASKGDKPCRKPLKRKLEFQLGDNCNVEVPATAVEFGTSHPSGCNQGELVQGEDMPQFFNLLFRPREGIFFSNLELAVAAYVFDAEVLFPSEHTQGDRHAFCTLCPGEEIIDDVINQLATVLIDEYSELSWWLPMSVVVSSIAIIEGINDYNKMRLALDLIMSKSNPTRDEIFKLTCKHWDETHNNPATRRNNQGIQPSAEALLVVSSSSKSLTI
ncbi:hypothetical protein HN51_031044 [Arachis hypogaea]